MSVDRDPNENDRGPSGAEVLASLITDALEKAKLVSWSQSFFIKLSIIVEKIPSGKLWKVSQILIIFPVFRHSSRQYSFVLNSRFLQKLKGTGTAFLRPLFH